MNQLVLPTNSNARALTVGRSSLVADFISLLQVGKHTFCFLCLDLKGGAEDSSNMCHFFKQKFPRGEKITLDTGLLNE